MSMWKPWSEVPKPEEGKKILIWWAGFKPEDGGIDFAFAAEDGDGWRWVADATHFAIYEYEAPDYWTDDIPPECM